MDQATKIIRELETAEYKMDDLLDLMKSNPISTRALGALISQLRRYEMHHEVIRTAEYKLYLPNSS